MRAEGGQQIRGEGGVQRAECDVISRVDRVRRAGSAGAQREVSPDEERAQGTGQTAKGGRKTR